MAEQPVTVKRPVADPRVYVDLLPDHPASFVVLTDTHLVDPGADHAGEFGSRLKQNDRVEVALALAASLGVETAVHLGDLVQDYPDSDTHRPLLRTAIAQVRGIAATVHCASGNTDVGDKTDPSSPAVLAGPDTVAPWAEEVAAPWSVFEVAGLRGIILASSLFNSGTDLEAAQWTWLEETLAAPTDHPTVFFWHHAPFLATPDDPGTGNYDTIAEPARTRVLTAIRDHGLGVFTGHSHFWFRTVIGPTAQGYGTNSTSFTRPGFSELFSSAAPADRGRDDQDKLGFLLVRVHGSGNQRHLRVHQVRSGTTTQLRLTGRRVDPVLTGTPRDLPGSALAVVMRHPIAAFGEIPDTFPSVVRQPVRDDHALLALLELGAGAVSVGIEDCRDPRLAVRLDLLRREGVEVAARLVWPAGEPLALDPAWPVDRVELVLLDRDRLTATELAELARQHAKVTLSTLTRTPKGAAELSRWRYGFSVDAATALSQACRRAGIDATLVLADGEPVTRADHQPVHRLPPHLSRQGHRRSDLVRMAQAFLAAAAAGSRLWVDPFTELDRTLETSPGLLERQRNPQPGFHLLRVMNTLCHAAPAEIDLDRWQIRRDDLTATLWPDRPPVSEAVDTSATVIDLSTGMVEDDRTHDGDEAGPWLLISRDRSGSGSSPHGEHHRDHGQGEKSEIA